jgi:RNA polymerase sigma factor (TIGR02999 family)
MNDVTRILSAIEQGDPHAAEQLLPIVYEELRRLAARRLAREKPGQTLQATALVHEAYLGLVGGGRGRRWEGRDHFFAVAAEAMRLILINRARDKGRLKHGGGLRRIDLDRVELGYEDDRLDMLALDEALTRLTAEEPECGRLVKLRFFAGLTSEEAAEVLGVTRRTADRYWAYARAWLLHAMEEGDGGA